MSLSITNDESLTVRGTSKVQINGKLTIKNHDGDTTIDVITTADLQDVPLETQEHFLSMLQHLYNTEHNVYDGWRNKDGSEVKLKEELPPWDCPKCGALVGTFGKVLEKWLPFLFSHNCELERKKRKDEVS